MNGLENVEFLIDYILQRDKYNLIYICIKHNILGTLRWKFIGTLAALQPRVKFTIDIARQNPLPLQSLIIRHV